MKKIYGITHDSLLSKGGVKVFTRSTLVDMNEIINRFQLLLSSNNLLLAITKIARIMAEDEQKSQLPYCRFIENALTECDQSHLSVWKDIYKWQSSISPFKSYMIFEVSQLYDFESNNEDRIVKECTAGNMCFRDIVNFIWLKYIRGSKLKYHDEKWYIINGTHTEEIHLTRSFFYTNLVDKVSMDVDGHPTYIINTQLFNQLLNITSLDDYGVRL